MSSASENRSPVSVRVGSSSSYAPPTPPSTGGGLLKGVRSSGVEASILPLGLGGLALVLSIALAIWTATTAQLTTLNGSFQLPLADPASWPLSLVGYLLTPLTVVIALGWDRVAQRQGLRKNKDFVIRSGYSKALRFIVVGGFIVALWHVVNLAYVLAGMFAA